MREPSIRRKLLAWVLGTLGVGAVALMLIAYFLTLHEVDEIMDDSLMQAARLLADRDLRGAIALGTDVPLPSAADTESKLVAIARRPDGSLLFTSEPEISLSFLPTPGKSTQHVGGAQWHVFTVVQSDRVIQVAQPASARREGAVEAASRLVIPLAVLIALIGAVLPGALRRGMKPLAFANDALGLRNARSLEPLDVRGMPLEILPVVRTLNDLLRRLQSAFAAQRNFVADAAHELRSPVTALQLQVQILEASRDPVERSLATAELATGIGRTRRLIEQLLYLSRASADESGDASFVPQNVDLSDLARDVVVRWSREAERRGIDLGADAMGVLSVAGNAAQLEIMLSNLVENALRYTRRGGVVDVIAAQVEGLPTLRVVDDGPGIALAERERVFDRFYRSPEAVASEESGSGLGLAIVRSIAEKHGAVVLLHTAPSGRGLEVRVSFKASA
jgi:two-component system, OmpR family, sensor kinase